MAIAALDIAQSMGLSESELMRRALTVYLREQRREVLQTRMELLARYGANDVADLESRIADATVPEHPGWEDLIVAENLDARLEELDDYLRGI